MLDGTQVDNLTMAFNNDMQTTKGKPSSTHTKKEVTIIKPPCFPRQQSLPKFVPDFSQERLSMGVTNSSKTKTTKPESFPFNIQSKNRFSYIE